MQVQVQVQVQVVLLGIRPLEFPLVYSMAVSLSSSGCCRYATYSDFLTDGPRPSLGPNRLMYRIILRCPDSVPDGGQCKVGDRDHPVLC